MTYWGNFVGPRAAGGWTRDVQLNFKFIRTRTGPCILNELINSRWGPQKVLGRLYTPDNVQAIRPWIPAVSSVAKTNIVSHYYNINRFASLNFVWFKHSGFYSNIFFLTVFLYIKWWMAAKNGVNPMPPAIQMTVRLLRTSIKGLPNGPSTNNSTSPSILNSCFSWSTFSANDHNAFGMEI